MCNLKKAPHAPAPDGTLGHDARSASQRTRLGAGAEGRADSVGQHERDEQIYFYTLHDAIAEHGFPVPIEAIYRANTVPIEQLRTLQGEHEETAPMQAIVAPPLVERMAENDRLPLPAPCTEWVKDVKEGEPSWIWLRAVPVESAMTAALLMLRKTGLSGRVGRLGDFASLCRQAPLYGERSRETVVRSWAQERSLALAISEQDQLDAFMSEVLLSLLHQRCDALLPTIIAADAPGAQILGGANLPRKEARLREELVRVMNTGLSGFSPHDPKTPRTVNLSRQTESHPSCCQS